MASLMEIIGHLSDPFSGGGADVLMALHALNEHLLLRASGDGGGGGLPHAATQALVPALTGVLHASISMMHTSELYAEMPALVMRALSTLVESDAESPRIMARPATLAALRSHLQSTDSETGEVAGKLILRLASHGVAMSLLRSRTLAEGLALLRALTHGHSRSFSQVGVQSMALHVYAAILFATDGFRQREDAALLLDMLPTLTHTCISFCARVVTHSEAVTRLERHEQGASLIPALHRLMAHPALGVHACVGAHACQCLSSHERDVCELSQRCLARITTCITGISHAIAAHVADRGAAAEASTADQHRLPVWPLQALLHIVRAGVPDALAAVLLTHAVVDIVRPPAMTRFLSIAGVRTAVRAFARLCLAVPAAARQSSASYASMAVAAVLTHTYAFTHADDGDVVARAGATGEDRQGLLRVPAAGDVHLPGDDLTHTHADVCEDMLTFTEAVVRVSSVGVHSDTADASA